MLLPLIPTSPLESRKLGGENEKGVTLSIKSPRQWSGCLPEATSKFTSPASTHMELIQQATNSRCCEQTFTRK